MEQILELVRKVLSVVGILVNKRPSYTTASKKAMVEFSIGKKKVKYGESGRGYIRAVEFEKGRNSQIIVECDPSEYYELSVNMKKAVQKGESLPGFAPHKYKAESGENTTIVYADVKKIEGKTLYGFTVVRQKEGSSDKNIIRVPVTAARFSYICALLQQWSFDSAFVELPEREDKGDKKPAPIDTKNGNPPIPDEVPIDTDNIDMAEFDNIPF